MLSQLRHLESERDAPGRQGGIKWRDIWIPIMDL